MTRLSITAIVLACGAWLTGCSTKVWVPTGASEMSHKTARDLCLRQTRNDSLCKTYGGTHLVDRTSGLILNAIYRDGGGWCELVMQSCMEDHGWALKDRRAVDDRPNLSRKSPINEHHTTTARSYDLRAVIKTDKGDIHLKLYADKAPLTVMNFVNLAQRGYYDGLMFHRVIADFMIQGGDPTGTGSGGPGYKFEDEFHPDLCHDSAGILSMANSGPATNGSQFFITHKDTSWLDGKHSVFGKVTKGQEVVDAVAQGDVMNEVVIGGDPTELFKAHQKQLDECNAVLDKKFPRTRK